MCLEQEAKRDELYTRILPGLLRSRIVGRCNDKSCDFILENNKGQITAEVKQDKLASKTGNLAVETNGNYGQSTLEASTADWWVFFVALPDGSFDIYLFETEKLKQLITHPDVKTRYGLEGSKLRLVPLRLCEDALMARGVR